MAIPTPMSGERQPDDAGSAPADLVDWPGIIDALAEAVVAADAAGRIVYVNAAAELLLGWGTKELIGAPLTDVIPDRFKTRHGEAFGNFVRTGEGHLLGRPLRVPALRRDGTETPVELVISRTSVLGRGVIVGLLRDASERVEIEGPGDLSDRLVTSLAESASLEEAWPRVLQAAVEELGWDLAQLWLHNGSQELERVSAWAAPGTGYEGFLEASSASFRPGEGLPGRVWQSFAPVWVTRVEDDDPDFPRGIAAAAAGLRSGFGFPLAAGSRLLGVIELFSVHRRNPNPAMSRRLVELGRELGWFLERRSVEEQRLALLDSERKARAAAEAAQQELEHAWQEAAQLASTLQRSLLPPHLPDIPGVALGARYRPAGRGSQVGGDFYDVFRLAGGAWGAVIGDVCGKGAEAATVTAFARYTARAAAMQDRSPARALAMVNTAMLANAADGGPDLFATAVLARLRPQAGRLALSMACAGHPLPLVRRSTGQTEPVGRPGTLLGVVSRFEVRDCEVVLGPGDALVLVTDGVLEATRNGKQWGEKRLVELLESLGAASPGQVADAVATKAVEYQGGSTRDDIAVLVVGPRSD